MKTEVKITSRNIKGQTRKTIFLVRGKQLPKDKKYCRPCDEVKNKSDFTSKGGVCKSCANRRARKHYRQRAKNKQWLLERRKNQTIKNRKRKAFAVGLMGGRCFRCDGKFPDCVYDFHHPKDNKSYNISDLFKMGLRRLKTELKKCDLLCSNCHRIVTYKTEYDALD